MNPGSKTFVRLTFLLIIIWQLILVFQGLDLADTGFHLTAFRYIVEDPYAVQYSMSFWLSDIFGHIWMALRPAGGLIWARLGSVFFLTVTILLYYKALKPELGAKESAVGLFLVSLIAVKGGFECLNYDIFSMLGFCIVTILLFRGLSRNRIAALFFSGFALGITVFFKLTNISGILLFLAIPFSVYLKGDGLKGLLKMSLAALSGTILGIGVVLLLLLALDHWDLFFSNLSFISGMANDGTASHGFMPLLISYLKGYINAFVLLIIFLSAFLLFNKISVRYKLKLQGKPTVVIGITVLVLTILLMAFFGNAIWSKIRYLLIGLMFWAGFLYALDTKRSYNERILPLIGVILLIVAPLGSDAGLGKSVFGMWIIGPVLFARLDIKPLLRPLNISVPITHSKLIRIVLIILLAGTSVMYAWQNTYFDAGSRLHKKYPVDHHMLRSIYTSEERAVVLQELVDEGFPLMEEEYLLSFIEIPMIHYLKDIKPFISTSWPKLYYNPQSFESKLQEALSIRKELPLIIRQKQNTKMHPWPEITTNPEYLNYPAELSQWPEHGKVLNNFIDKHNYQIIWENEMFQLLRVDSPGSLGK